jgi:DNA ligase 4
LKSDGTDEGTRHFLLVFFDILYIEGQSLLDEPYQKRRKKLEVIVQVIEGFVRVCLPPSYAVD